MRVHNLERLAREEGLASLEPPCPECRALLRAGPQQREHSLDGFIVRADDA